MARRLLPVAAAVMTCLINFPASAADPQNLSPATSNALRAQVDAKRQQLTGADAVTLKKPTGEQALLDVPVDTADAPVMDEKKP
ncbi:hypothetical protein V2K05_16235 [Pseudomonas alliivorans]|nr:hypothetical protein [Pseudomonas alliivorans]MEE4959907.1 hypothetical protein [Pseudomonas alliivorans]MEE4971116.1 hypothetical protein [Pseudomonas alliivorans]MEE4976705.1 hypothetical protein [Pseudomonas alliivorans]MEE4981831.1 hypothetical protein [Pseudomonas alliivorans]